MKDNGSTSPAKDCVAKKSVATKLRLKNVLIMRRRREGGPGQTTHLWEK